MSRSGCPASHVSTAGVGGSAVRGILRRRVGDIVRRDTPGLDVLAGDRADEHQVDVFRAQITGRARR